VCGGLAWGGSGWEPWRDGGAAGRGNGNVCATCYCACVRACVRDWQNQRPRARQQDHCYRLLCQSIEPLLPLSLLSLRVRLRLLFLHMALLAVLAHLTVWLRLYAAAFSSSDRQHQPRSRAPIPRRERRRVHAQDQVRLHHSRLTLAGQQTQPPAHSSLICDGGVET
jgi:hypothetical protein